MPLAERGCQVVAVELGAELAAVARRNLTRFPQARVEVVTAAFERWDPDTPPGGVRLPAAAEVGQDSQELERSGHFGPVVVRHWAWEQAYSTTAYLELLQTYSGHRAMSPTARRGLLDRIATLIDTRFGGRIRKRYLTELRVAYRRAAVR